MLVEGKRKQDQHEESKEEWEKFSDYLGKGNDTRKMRSFRDFRHRPLSFLSSKTD